MEQAFSIILEKMVVVLILVAIGFAATKIGLLNETVLKGLSTTITKVLLPALIITMLPMENGREKLLSGLPTILASAFILMALFILCGVCVAKLFKLHSTTYYVHLICATFGNQGLMGIPIISAVFGSEGVLYLSLYLVVDQALLWTIGTLILYKDTGKNQGFQPKKLFNPTTIALVIGLGLLIADITPSGIVFNTIDTLGSTTSPLAMVYIGGALASISLKHLNKDASILFMAVIKMILLPVAVWYILGWCGFGDMARVVLALCTGMPTMLSVSMLAQTAGSDWEYGVQATTLTTLLSLGTLPLVVYLTTVFLPKL